MREGGGVKRQTNSITAFKQERARVLRGERGNMVFGDGRGEVISLCGDFLTAQAMQFGS